MMERNSFIHRAFIGGVNPANHLGSRGSAADVERFREPESFNDVVKVGRRRNRKTSEENCATFLKKRLQPLHLSSNSLFKGSNISGSSWGQHHRKVNAVDGNFLLR
ncbi:hypothetical protein HanRHA438_Chr05g0217111 [Helianthus annuus]|nr:hypothetical protein HanRHA438_Chr05g0217111 [Helianthus annuus]